MKYKVNMIQMKNIFVNLFYIFRESSLDSLGNVYEKVLIKQKETSRIFKGITNIDNY